MNRTGCATPGLVIFFIEFLERLENAMENTANAPSFLTRDISTVNRLLIRDFNRQYLIIRGVWDDTKEKLRDV
jgi:hypothetical protein